MTPEEITIEALEQASGIPVAEWHGKCTIMARFAAMLLDEDCDEIYGHYNGFIDQDGYWGGRPLVQHGWVLLSDGRVLDPTRWSFENVEPYVYLDDNEDDYDEGGDVFREANERPCPPPGGRQLELTEHLQSAPLFENLTGTPFNKLTMNEVVWVANLSYSTLDFAVGPIYQTLIENSLGAFIPQDNRLRAIREKRIEAKAG